MPGNMLTTTNGFVNQPKQDFLLVSIKGPPLEVIPFAKAGDPAPEPLPDNTGNQPE